MHCCPVLTEIRQILPINNCPCFRQAARSLLRKNGMDRQNRSAMRQWVWRCVVTIHAKLACSSRTLVRQTDAVLAGAARKLKILVSWFDSAPGCHQEYASQNAHSCKWALSILGFAVPGSVPFPKHALKRKKKTSLAAMNSTAARRSNGSRDH